MKRNIPNLSLYAILILIVVVMILLNPTRFPTMANFRSMAYQLPLLAFLSLGMMIPILSGGINLGIVATANFTGIITALTLRSFTGGNPTEASGLLVIISMAMGILAAMGAGLLSGFLTGYLRVPDMLATLGTMTLLNGVNIVLTKGYTLTGFPKSLITIGNGLFLGIPIPFYIFVIFTFILYIILDKTTFGYSLYMLGSNYTAAKFSNIDTKSIILKGFLLSSLFSAITAFIMIGQLNSVKANYAESYLLVAILACFLGGADPSGGVGKVSGMVVSVVILQVISSGVNLLRMDPFFIRAMWGFIIIAVLAINYFNEKAKSRIKVISNH
jgi:ribose/xylose/arabinose/galactoside ABC-type transport system permease subunit